MKYTLLLLLATTALVACAKPEPLCNREAQEWNKFDTVEDECVKPKPIVRLVNPSDPKNPIDVVDPEDPDDEDDGDDDHTDPDDEDDGDDEDHGKVKSDNSDANGKGGNSHNRFDKNRYPQEIAENNKI